MSVPAFAELTVASLHHPITPLARVLQPMLLLIRHVVRVLASVSVVTSTELLEVPANLN
jgi:hypothetical protein